MGMSDTTDEIAAALATLLRAAGTPAVTALPTCSFTAWRKQRSCCRFRARTCMRSFNLAMSGR